jgi:hypothetical protein
MLEGSVIQSINFSDAKFLPRVMILLYVFYKRDSESIAMIRNLSLMESLPDSIVNIEDKTRSNLFSWRGQFSPQLIESLLKAYAKPNSKIFDPFLGSGTVLYEAALLDLSACGTEINPAATAFARIYELCNVEKKFITDAISQIETFLFPYINKLPAYQTRQFSDFQIDVLEFYQKCSDEVLKNILNAFIVGLDFNLDINFKRVENVWKTLKNSIDQLPYTTKKIQCFESDARKVSLTSEIFDIVITSPPYINVFNYHQNYRKSVELLGIDVLSVARSEIGANRKFRQNRFLTVVQYCMDMAQVFLEIKRVCTQDAKIIFIVGRESNVKNIAFYNAKLLKDVASISGLSILGTQSRCFENKFGQKIYEEILRFGIENKINVEDNIDQARYIGIEALKDSVNRAKSEVKLEIFDAITKSQFIETSPMLGG